MLVALAHQSLRRTRPAEAGVERVVEKGPA